MPPIYKINGLAECFVETFTQALRVTLPEMKSLSQKLLISYWPLEQHHIQ